MKVNEQHLYEITDDNVITVSGMRPIRAKSIRSAIAVGLREAGTRDKVLTLWFTDKPANPNEEKKSRHYHIAFLRKLQEEEKKSITSKLLFNCECYNWGDKSKIVRFGCLYSMQYLMNHGEPFAWTC